MKFYVLVGLGPNDVQITSLVFSSKEKLLETVVPLLGEPRNNGVADLFWDCPDFDNVEDENGDYENPELVKHFYTHYYGGCGECWAFEVREVEEGKPFCEFDLD